MTIVSTALPTIVGDLGGLNHISPGGHRLLALRSETAVMFVYGSSATCMAARSCCTALVLFLIGSALCGLSTSLTELVSFRAIQGSGGGGLMVGAMAAIGDVVTLREPRALPGAVRRGLRARERDRAAPRRVLHQLAFVAVDLLRESADRRRCVRGAGVDPAEHQRAGAPAHRLSKAATLALALVALVLMCTFGGVDYKWLSPEIIAWGLATIVLPRGVPADRASRRRACPAFRGCSGTASST